MRSWLLFTWAVASGLTPAVWAATADPLAATPNAVWNAEKAGHLLRRAGFGGAPEEIYRLTRLGRDRAVNELVDYHLIEQDDPDYPADALLKPPPYRPFREVDRPTRQKLQAAVRRVGAGGMASLQDWWLRQMTVTRRPLEEKMTLFWHGHFTSGFREVRRPDLLYRQNAFLRANALGNFKTLVKGISRDPAMLIYLDNGRNVKAHPNENYARELLELFTLGEGHYTEQDVKEAARAFTGWTSDQDGHFVIRRRQHDDGMKTFLGRTGRFDGDDIIDIIFEQPAAARFLAHKLWTFFVEPEPDPAIIDALAEVIRQNDYDLRETLRVILRSDAFYRPETRFALIKSPAELIVSTARTLEVPLADLRTANQAMAAMGQELFQPPNVKGWDGGRNWINTSTLFLRYNAMKRFVDGTRGGGSKAGRAMRMERNGRMDRMKDAPLAALADEMRELPEPVREWLREIRMPPHYSEAQPPYDPLPILERERLNTAEKVVEHYVSRLLQMPLTRDRQKVLMEALEAGGVRFDPRMPGAVERVRAVVHLIMSMPEYQLN